MTDRKLVLDESVRPHVSETEFVVHRGASLAGYRFSGLEIRCLRRPLLERDLDWLNTATAKVVPNIYGGEA